MCRSWYSLMSMRTMFSSVSNSAAASVLASSVLPTPVGPRKTNEPIGRRGILDAGTGTDDRVGDELDGLVLADDPLVQDLVELQQLLALALLQPADRDAGPARHDLGDLVLGHHLAQQPPPRPACAASCSSSACSRRSSSGSWPWRSSAARLRSYARSASSASRRTRSISSRSACTFVSAWRSASHWARMASASARRSASSLRSSSSRALLGRASVLLGERGLFDLEPHDTPGELVELGRHRVDLGAEHRARLVDEVDGLVGQEAVGDVAMAQHDGRDERAVLDLHAVEHLEPLAQAAQDRDRVLDRGLVDEHRLEAAFEGGVLLDVLAVLVEGGRADHVQLAAGEHRLEHVAGVHRAFGGAGADDGVQLVDEEQDAALGRLAPR